MTREACSRKWQVEAARDGRLQGKDLESAERHRAVCAECAREARNLELLGHRMTALPTLPRDEVSVRRSRERLMAAQNQTVLESPSVNARRAAVVAMCGAAAVAIGYASWREFVRSSTVAQRSPVVEVHAEPGARWKEESLPELDKVVFDDGAATFLVRPHPSTRVSIQLPDGVLEDMGTVFQVRVHDGHTSWLSVSNGRVMVRLGGRIPFSLTTGQTWQPEADLPSPREAISNDPITSVSSPAPTESAKDGGMTSVRTPQRPTRATVRPGTTSESSAARGRNEESLRHASNPGAGESTREEDDAYLRIIELLAQGRAREAQMESKAYLLRFPNGFRRFEVLNIATRASDTAATRSP